MDSGVHTGADPQARRSRRMLGTPSSKGTGGFQPRQRAILPMSAQVHWGSPGRFGTWTTGPPISSTRWWIDWGFPAPRLKTSPVYSERAAMRNARATSVTYTKSRRWVPSPTTVIGRPFAFWARKTPKTAPYAPVVRTRGPYTLNMRIDTTGRP